MNHDIRQFHFGDSDVTKIRLSKVKKVNFEIYIADRKTTICIAKAFSAPLC